MLYSVFALIRFRQGFRHFEVITIYFIPIGSIIIPRALLYQGSREKMFAESVIDYRNFGNQKSVLAIFYP